MGILLDKEEDDGEEVELVPSTPEKAATWRLFEQSPQQCEGGALDKRTTQMDPDPSSLVLIPTLPPPSTSVCTHSSGPASPPV